MREQDAQANMLPERRGGDMPPATGDQLPATRQASPRKQASPKRLWGVLRWLVPLVVLAGGIGWFRARPAVVPVAAPQARMVVESIAASGRVSGDVETNVGAQVAGVVAQVPVREGDRVQPGQVIARIDDALLASQVAQAEAAVRSTQAQLVQTSRPPLASDVTRLRADVRQNTAVARARLTAAQQRVTELQAGATLEERQQAQAQVDQARAQEEQARVDGERQQQLARQGAVAQAEADRARTAYRVAQEALQNARARLRQLQIGARAEVLAQARADVRAAEAALAGAQTSGAAQLRSLLSQPRFEDVQVAQARLREAEQALAVSQRRREDAVVRAPFAGTVTQIVTERGGVAGPNQPVVRLVRTTRPEIRIDVDENHLGKLRARQEAIVTSDAFAGQRFGARVREIGAAVDPERGTVEVRLDPVRPPSWLRPGQTVSVNILVDKGSRRLVVPLTSVTTVGGTSTVLLVRENKIVRREVVIGPAGPDGVPVLSGLDAQDRVVVDPTGLAPGRTVRPELVGALGAL